MYVTQSPFLKVVLSSSCSLPGDVLWVIMSVGYNIHTWVVLLVFKKAQQLQNQEYKLPLWVSPIWIDIIITFELMTWVKLSFFNGKALLVSVERSQMFLEVSTSICLWIFGFLSTAHKCPLLLRSLVLEKPLRILEFWSPLYSSLPLHKCFLSLTPGLMVWIHKVPK